MKSQIQETANNQNEPQDADFYNAHNEKTEVDCSEQSCFGRKNFIPTLKNITKKDKEKVLLISNKIIQIFEQDNIQNFKDFESLKIKIIKVKKEKFNKNNFDATCLIQDLIYISGEVELLENYSNLHETLKRLNYIIEEKTETEPYTQIETYTQTSMTKDYSEKKKIEYKPVDIIDNLYATIFDMIDRNYKLIDIQDILELLQILTNIIPELPSPIE